MEIFEMQKEFDELMKSAQALIEKLKKEQVADDRKKVDRWKPKDGDRVWFINDNGDLEDTTYLEGCDELSFKLGNRFKTEAEALKELDRRIAEKELLDMVDSKMSDKNDKWFIEYDTQESYFYPNNTFFRFTTPFIFSSKESCEKAINKLGEDKLKLVFRID